MNNNKKTMFFILPFPLFVKGKTKKIELSAFMAFSYTSTSKNKEYQKVIVYFLVILSTTS